MDQQWAKRLGRDIDVVELTGEPGQEIVRMAREDHYDLIAVAFPEPWSEATRDRRAVPGLVISWNMPPARSSWPCRRGFPPRWKRNVPQRWRAPLGLAKSWSFLAVYVPSSFLVVQLKARQSPSPRCVIAQLLSACSPCRCRIVLPRRCRRTRGKGVR